MMRTNVYQMVTDRIIKQLEDGIIPWKKPWNLNGTRAFNRVSGKAYGPINQMLLNHTGEYATFKQWTDLGGKIKKGAKAEIIVFWKLIEIKTEEEGEKIIKKIPFLKYSNVFHISQIENIQPLEQSFIEVRSIRNAETVIEDYVKRENINFQEKVSNDAFYRPCTDSIVVPEKQQFEDINEFYSTAFHEMVHSTGHKERLNRSGIGGDTVFGSKTYSFEELIAEIGTAILLNTIGIETDGTFKNNAAYIHGWLKVLKDDNKFIFSASKEAQKAVEYIFMNEEIVSLTEDIEQGTES